MLGVSSNFAGSRNSQWIKLDFVDEVFSPAASRLSRAVNCCEETRSSWKEFNRLMSGISLIPELKFYEVMPVILGNIRSIKNMVDSIDVDGRIGEMKLDGSIAYMAENGVCIGDLESGVLIRDSGAVDKVCLIFDKNDAPRAVKQFLCHFYLKTALPELLREKIPDILMLHTVIHRAYSPANNGMYPLLKWDGAPYEVKLITKRSMESDSGVRYPRDRMEAFVAKDLTAEARENLYNQLEVRRLGLQDLVEHERWLTGKYGVFAAHKIARGKCIGVHGGTIFCPGKIAADYGISINELVGMVNVDYLIEMRARLRGSEEFFQDGNNIISKINSIFHRSGDDWWTQAEHGYNVESAMFRCRLDDGAQISLPAFFAVRDIQRGEELRVNYYYCRELVTLIKNTEEIIEKAIDEAKSEDLVKSILSLTARDPV